jgi:hypothetical protein
MIREIRAVAFRAQTAKRVPRAQSVTVIALSASQSEKLSLGQIKKPFFYKKQKWWDPRNCVRLSRKRGSSVVQLPFKDKITVPLISENISRRPSHTAVKWCT